MRQDELIKAKTILAKHLLQKNIIFKTEGFRVVKHDFAGHHAIYSGIRYVGVATYNPRKKIFEYKLNKEKKNQYSGKQEAFTIGDYINKVILEEKE